MSDLISRAKALNAINAGKTLEEAFRNVTALPSVEPERKTGHWVYIPEESEEHIEKIYRCSACNNNDAWGATELTKYCSWCGAKMIGVKEDEDTDIS